MSMRMISVALIVVATTAGAQAATVQLARYDAKFSNGVHSALCVIPMRNTPAAGGRFVCIYSIPGAPKVRDDTDGKLAIRPTKEIDPNFNEWLGANLEGSARCVLNSAMAGDGFPAEDSLTFACAGAAYVSETIETGTPLTFIDEVRKAVTKKLPPPATASPMPAQLIRTTAPPPPPPVDETSTVMTGTLDTAAETQSATSSGTATYGPDKPEQAAASPQRKLSEGITRALVIFIAIVAGFLGIDRLVQLFQPRRSRDPEDDQAKSLTQAVNTLDEIAKRLQLQKEAPSERLVQSERALLNLGGAETPDEAINALQAKLRKLEELNELATGVQQLYDKVRPDGGDVPRGDQLAAIEGELHDLRNGVSDRDSTIANRDSDLNAVRSYLSAEWRDIVPGDVTSTMAMLTARMRDAHSRAANLGCATDVSPDVLVTELATSLHDERNASRETAAILRNLREYLALPDRETSALSAVIASEFGTPNRILRLALAATLRVLKEKVSVLAADEHAKVVRMLSLGEIVARLETFLEQLHRYEGDQLWEVGIRSGLSLHWIHKLFRAEAVLRAYFTKPPFAELSDLLAVIGWAFRNAIVASGFDVDRVQLLAMPLAHLKHVDESTPEFRSCPDIRARVQAVLKTQRDGGFTVDVDSVGVRNAEVVIERGAVMLAKRIDWED